MKYSKFEIIKRHKFDDSSWNMREAKLWKKYCNYLKLMSLIELSDRHLNLKMFCIGYNTNISQIFVEWMLQNIYKSYQVEFVFEKLD